MNVSLNSRYWNGRVLGIPAAILSMSQVVFRSMADLLSTRLWKGNLQAFGPRSRVQYGSLIRNPGRIVIGSDALIGRGVVIDGEIPTGTLRIGNGSQISTGCNLDISGNLTIGENVLLSPDCVIFTHSHGYDPKSSPIGTTLLIDDGAWIGANVMILPCVKRIGKHSIVGAGSVVTRDVEDNCIVAGNPARVIRTKEGHTKD